MIYRNGGNKWILAFLNGIDINQIWHNGQLIFQKPAPPSPLGGYGRLYYLDDNNVEQSHTIDSLADWNLLSANGYGYGTRSLTYNIPFSFGNVKVGNITCFEFQDDPGQAIGQISTIPKYFLAGLPNFGNPNVSAQAASQQTIYVPDWITYIDEGFIDGQRTASPTDCHFKMNVTVENPINGMIGNYFLRSQNDLTTEVIDVSGCKEIGGSFMMGCTNFVGNVLFNPNLEIGGETTWAIQGNQNMFSGCKSYNKDIIIENPDLKYIYELFGGVSNVNGNNSITDFAKEIRIKNTDPTKTFSLKGRCFGGFAFSQTSFSFTFYPGCIVDGPIFNQISGNNSTVYIDLYCEADPTNWITDNYDDPIDPSDPSSSPSGYTSRYVPFTSRRGIVFRLHGTYANQVKAKYADKTNTNYYHRFMTVV